MTIDPREYYENKFQEQLSELGEEVNEFEVKLEDSGWEPENDYHEQIDELRIKLEEAGDKLEELKVSSNAEWPKTRKNMELELLRLEYLMNKTSSLLEKILLE